MTEVTLVELNKKQAQKVVEDYIESMSTQEYQQFIIRHIKAIKRWRYVDMPAIQKAAASAQRSLVKSRTRRPVASIEEV